MKKIFALLILCQFFSCISIKTSHQGNYGGGLQTQEKNSKKILKRVRKKSTGGKLGISLFTIENNQVEGKSTFSRKEMKIIESEVSRIAELVKYIGDQSWYSATFGVRNELIPTINVDVEINSELSAHTDCENNKVVISTGLLQKIYSESLKESFEMNEKMEEDYGGDFMDFKIKTEFSYFDNLINLKGQRMGIFKMFNEDKFDEFAENMQTSLELERVANFAAMEYLKSLLFILSHETYHKISGCKISKETELEADVFAAVVYQLLFQNQNNNREGIAGLLLGDFQENVVASNIIQFMQGRALHDIVYETYTKTPFEQGSAIHLPLEDRIKFMEEKTRNEGVDALHMFISGKILEYSH